MLGLAEKRAGRVLTPESVAKALCCWAISSPSDVVLDLGVGEGVFALASIERLHDVGASVAHAAAQIHGAELDRGVFTRAQRHAEQTLGLGLPNVVCADFHQIPLPVVDAVVGNPPYIRRHYQPNPTSLRTASGLSGSGFADAYCYFLLRASQALRPGGRMAVLVSASWLDMKYGRELKRLLTEQFRIRLLLGFEGKLFTNALVKPVVILAEKSPSDNPTLFAQVPEATSLEAFDAVLSELVNGTAAVGLGTTRVAKSELSVDKPWSVFFKSPELTRRLVGAIGLKPLGSVAETRIGLQTFAKSFFVLNEPQIAKWGIEAEFLAPVAFSPRYLKGPVVVAGTKSSHYVFACDRPLGTLSGTAAAMYVAHGMDVRVRVRGKSETVSGYHEAPRLVRARRMPWYNLRTEINRRGTYPILLPRRVFKSCLVAHNQASVVANEDFIEVRPLVGQEGLASLLSFFNSHLGEFIIRSHGFQYGGGVFNLNPSRARELPVPDPLTLSSRARGNLEVAWGTFVAEHRNSGARDRLTQTVAAALSLPPDLTNQTCASLKLLAGLSVAAQKPYSRPSPQNATLW